MCWSYNRQHGARFLAAMPTNLYGPGDSYDLQNSHVLPALMRKVHEAKQRGERRVTLWGSGRPRREFLFSDDMAEACVFLMRLPDAEFSKLVAPAQAPLINVGAGSDQSIAELATLIAESLGYGGEFAYDASKPDGMPRKLLDSARIAALGWRPKVGLRARTHPARTAALPVPRQSRRPPRLGPQVDTLLGDAAKARRQLKWKPRVTFRKLVAEMAREDLKAAERDALISRHGYRAYGGRE